MFCSTGLVARIERAEADLNAAAARAGGERSGRGFTLDIAGGVACFAEEGSPFNKVAGLGFNGTPTGAELDAVESAYAAVGSSVQVELTHLADPEIGALLTTRGYRLEAFEDVLGFALTAGRERLVPAGIEIRPSDDAEFDAWLEVVADAVAGPDEQGVPWHQEIPRATYLNAERDLAAAGVSRYAAIRDGVLAGGAALRLTDGIAQFAGAATAPAHRRHGIQSALLSARLADAAAAGSDVAVITTQPGSKSQENAQRQGFALLYTRAVLVKAQAR
jgi:GNAT superfamily N-acetyltransferase